MFRYLDVRSPSSRRLYDMTERHGHFAWATNYTAIKKSHWWHSNQNALNMTHLRENYCKQDVSQTKNVNVFFYSFLASFSTEVVVIVANDICEPLNIMQQQS